MFSLQNHSAPEKAEGGGGARQAMHYNVTLRRVRVTIVDEEKQ